MAAKKQATKKAIRRQAGGSKPFVKGSFKLQKMAMKGGWTYASLPDDSPAGTGPFGYKRVSGNIDGHPIQGCNLMPIKGGGLFLPINAEIRKKTGKKQGDTVQIELYLDDQPIDLPEDLRLCLEDEPEGLKFFRSFTHSQQKHFITWIDQAKQEQTRVNRIAKCIGKILRGETLYNPFGKI